MKMPITIIIPTYNAGRKFQENASMLCRQTADIKQIYIIDSSSEDETVDIARKNGFTVETIARQDFGHGKTRQYALEKASTEIVVYMTQDAILTDEKAVENLVKYLCQNRKTAAVYGRQKPEKNSKTRAGFARIYNYGKQSYRNDKGEKNEKRNRLIFFSNVFAAYKKSLLMKIGGFPVHVEFGEDTYVAAKLILAGYQTGYCAQAAVYHVHEHSLYEEYKRYKQIGKFHREERWLTETFGKAEREGLKYVRSELEYFLKQRKIHELPSAYIHDIVKFLGYRVGKGFL